MASSWPDGRREPSSSDCQQRRGNTDVKSGQRLVLGGLDGFWCTSWHLIAVIMYQIQFIRGPIHLHNPHERRHWTVRGFTNGNACFTLHLYPSGQARGWANGGRWSPGRRFLDVRRRCYQLSWWGRGIILERIRTSWTLCTYKNIHTVLLECASA
jgi:hypothetical protein